MKKRPLEKRKGIDYMLLCGVGALLIFGLITLLQVLSDSFDGTETTFQAVWDRLNFSFFNRQVGNILISLVVAIPIALMDYEKYKPFLKMAYVLNVLLLAILLIAGKTTRGIVGWYTIGEGGSIRGFQPSEICKVTLILILSKVGARAYDSHGKLRFVDVVVLFALFAVPFVLVVLQPDFGTAMVMLVVFVCIVFALRIHWTYIVGGATAACISLPLIYKFLLSSDQKARIRVFLDPTLDPTGDGYNVLHAKQVIGSGGLWGKGYFTSGTLTQSGYVPERHTDFIFSGIVEGLGFMGGLFLVLLYALVLWRFFVAAKGSWDTFGRCLCIGCAGMLGCHVFENIGMNLGLMPVTGIPLPFISYGGSNMLASMLTVAIVFSVRYRTFHRGQI